MVRPELSVLIVCMGNICRSPTAEGVLRAKLAEAGLAGRVSVDSAGTHGYHVGEPPDRRASAAAAARGYDLSPLRCRELGPDDRRFDLVLAMDRGNLRLVRRVLGDDHDGVALFLAHDDPRDGDGSIGHEVPDPYSGGLAGFEHVLDLIEEGSEAWVARFERRLADAGQHEAPPDGSGT
jgi:protein-tyrosine phosphatase